MTDDLVKHHIIAGRLSRQPQQLRSLRLQILAACDMFISEMRSTIDLLEKAPDTTPSDSSHDRSLLAQVEQARAAIAEKPLDWFAERHDWNHAGDSRGAASLLKAAGKIGKGWQTDAT